MSPPPTERLRVTHAEDGLPRDGASWGDAFARAFDPANTDRPPEALKVLGSGEVTVWACRLVVGGRSLDAVIKLQPMRSVLDRSRAVARLSRHHRQRRGAAVLRRAGIPCARCLAILNSPGWEILVMDSVEGPSLLEWLMRPEQDRAQTDAVIDALGEHFRALREKRILNLDGKPSNLVLTGGVHTGEIATGEMPGVSIVVVDTVSIVALSRSLRRFDPRKRADWYGMLARLIKEPARFGHEPRRTLALRGLLRIFPELHEDRAALRRWWDEVGELVRLRDRGPPKERMPRVERARGDGGSRSAHVRER